MAPCNMRNGTRPSTLQKQDELSGFRAVLELGSQLYASEEPG